MEEHVHSILAIKVYSMHQFILYVYIMYMHAATGAGDSTCTSESEAIVKGTMYIRTYTCTRIGILEGIRGIYPRCLSLPHEGGARGW